MAFNNLAAEAPPASPKPQPTSGDTPSNTTPPPNADKATPESQDQEAEGFELLDDGSDDDDGPGGAPAADTDDEGSDPQAEVGRDAYTYEASDIPETGKELINEFADYSHESGKSPEEFKRDLDFHQGLVQRLQARLQTADEERRKEVRAQMTPTEIAAINAGSKALDKETRQALRQARLPNGQLLIHQPGVLQLLMGIGRPEYRMGATRVRVTGAAADEVRMGEIARVRKQDIGKYYADDLHREAEAISHRKAALEATSAEGPRPGDSQREAAIRAVLRNDANEYWRQGLDRELVTLNLQHGEDGWTWGKANVLGSTLEMHVNALIGRLEGVPPSSIPNVTITTRSAAEIEADPPLVEQWYGRLLDTLPGANIDILVPIRHEKPERTRFEMWSACGRSRGHISCNDAGDHGVTLTAVKELGDYVEHIRDRRPTRWCLHLNWVSGHRRAVHSARPGRDLLRWRALAPLTAGRS
jgi:hypothetical protein